MGFRAPHPVDRRVRAASRKRVEPGGWLNPPTAESVSKSKTPKRSSRAESGAGVRQKPCAATAAGVPVYPICCNVSRSARTA
jgi:hypothetical protein